MQKKLIERETGRLIAEIKDHQIQLYDEDLKTILTTLGIPIPVFLRDQFEGLTIVFYGHELFADAFFTVYYRFHMDSEQYEWTD